MPNDTDSQSLDHFQEKCHWYNIPKKLIDDIITLDFQNDKSKNDICLMVSALNMIFHQNPGYCVKHGTVRHFGNICTAKTGRMINLGDIFKKVFDGTYENNGSIGTRQLGQKHIATLSLLFLNNYENEEIDKNLGYLMFSLAVDEESNSQVIIWCLLAILDKLANGETGVEVLPTWLPITSISTSNISTCMKIINSLTPIAERFPNFFFKKSKFDKFWEMVKDDSKVMEFDHAESLEESLFAKILGLIDAPIFNGESESIQYIITISCGIFDNMNTGINEEFLSQLLRKFLDILETTNTEKSICDVLKSTEKVLIALSYHRYDYEIITERLLRIAGKNIEIVKHCLRENFRMTSDILSKLPLISNLTESELLGEDLSVASKQEGTNTMSELRKYLYQLSTAEHCIPGASWSAKKLMMDLKSENLQKFEQFIALHRDTLNLIIRKHQLTWLFVMLLPYPKLIALDIRIQYYHEAMDQTATIALLSECFEQYQASTNVLKRTIADAVVKLSVNVDNNENQFFDVAKIHRAAINEILCEAVDCPKAGELCSICLKYPDFVDHDVKQLYVELELMQLPMTEVEKIFEGLVHCLTTCANEEVILQTLLSINRLLKILGTASSAWTKRKIIPCAARNKTIFNKFFRQAGPQIYLLEVMFNEPGLIDFDIKLDNIVEINKNKELFANFASECVQQLKSHLPTITKISQVIVTMVKSWDMKDSEFQHFFSKHQALINAILRRTKNLELFVLSLSCVLKMDLDVRMGYLMKHTYNHQENLFLFTGIFAQLVSSPPKGAVALLLPKVEYLLFSLKPKVMKPLIDFAEKNSKTLNDILLEDTASFGTGAILKALAHVPGVLSINVKMVYVETLAPILNDSERLEFLSGCFSCINQQNKWQIKSTINKLMQVLAGKTVQKDNVQNFEFAKKHQKTIKHLLNSSLVTYGPNLFRLVAPFPEFCDFEHKIEYLEMFLSNNEQEQHWDLLEECMERNVQQCTTETLKAINGILWHLPKTEQLEKRHFDFASKYKDELNNILAMAIKPYGSVADLLTQFVELMTFENKMRNLPAVLMRIDKISRWTLLTECMERHVQTSSSVNMLVSMNEIMQNVLNTETWKPKSYHTDFADKYQNELNVILTDEPESAMAKFMIHFPQFINFDNTIKYQLSEVLKQNDTKSLWGLMEKCIERHIQQPTSNMLKPMNEILQQIMTVDWFRIYWEFAEKYKDTLNDILVQGQYTTCSSIVEYFAYYPEHMSFDNKVKYVDTVVKQINISELIDFSHECLAILKHQFTTNIRETSAAVKTAINYIPTENTEILNALAEQYAPELNEVIQSVGVGDGPAWRLLLKKLHMFKDFESKVEAFRSYLDLERSGAINMRFGVKRSDVFYDSYYLMNNQSLQCWKGRFKIEFVNEIGVDAGGLMREWFTILTREIFNPNYALFTTASDDNNSYTINKASHVNPEHLDYFKFVGRFIGKSIMEKQFVDCPFTKSLYKHILDIPVGFEDFESEDPIFCNSLKALLNNPISELGLDLTFSTDVEQFGVVSQKDLKENGKNIQVTDENKKEYVKLLCQMRMTGSIRQQLDSFLNGFYDIVPKHLIALFTVKELELLICGEPEIDINDLETNAIYEQYQRSDTYIRWFWRVVRSFDKDDKARLLMFVTGSSRAPPGGFANSEKLFVISKGGDNTRLPTAHTCFYKLVLPRYDSYEKLRQSLLTAIRECSEGFGFS